MGYKVGTAGGCLAVGIRGLVAYAELFSPLPSGAGLRSRFLMGQAMTRARSLSTWRWFAAGKSLLPLATGA